MNAFAKLAVAAVAVIAVGALGLTVLQRDATPVGGPLISPSPRASSSLPASTMAATDASVTVIGQYAEIHVGWVYVYADGRVVFHTDIGWYTGPYMVNERQLTQAGIDLVRSGAVPVSAILKDPGQLPTPAWADAEARLYEPARYAICYFLGTPQGGLGPDQEVVAKTVMDRLPEPAQTLLRGRERIFEVVGGEGATPPIVGRSRECSEVTPDEARLLFGILAAAGWNGELGILPDGGPSGELDPLEPGYWQANGSSDLVIDPEFVLPHGVIQAWGG